MPTYTYACVPNDTEFEEFHSIKIVLEDCPICKEKGLPPHAPKRLISGGSGRGIVELTGQELMDKGKEDARKFANEVQSSEKKYANILGEGKYQDMQQRMDKRRR